MIDTDGQKILQFCMLQIVGKRNFKSKYGHLFEKHLIQTFFVGPLAWPKENYPGNVLKARKCAPTKYGKSSLPIMTPAGRSVA